jgi:hypothetical protein
MPGRVYLDKLTLSGLGGSSLSTIGLSPNGVVSGDLGSLLLRNDAGNVALYQNTDGAMTWVVVGSGGGAGGWTDDGTVVRLTTATDTVAIGTATMFGAEKLRVIGDVRFEGKLTVTGVIDPTAVLLSDPLLGTALYFDSAPGQTAPNAPANHGRLRYNNLLKQWEGSVDGGPYTPFGGTSAGASSILIPVTATAGTFDSTALIPAGNRVTGVQVEILSPYDGAATITVGTPATPTAFQATTDNDPTITGSYLRQQDTLQALASVVRVTLGGAPTVGSAQVLISYTAILT